MIIVTILLLKIGRKVKGPVNLIPLTVMEEIKIITVVKTNRQLGDKRK